MCDEKCAAEALALLDAEEIRDLREHAKSIEEWLSYRYRRQGWLSLNDEQVKKICSEYLQLTDPETGELAILRSQNRDLQQAYDHVLECEQNRCREVVELQDRLAAVTAERDELRRRIDDAPVYLFEDNIRTGPGLLRDDETGKYRTQYKAVTRVRLVRDDQPGEADA